uniref:Alginate lyase 2 domain-containing protein n=1 Tax=Pseudomonas phage Arace01 TaxID=3138526 RepID=A0AAU6W0H4_9VIRU
MHPIWNITAHGTTFGEPTEAPKELYWLDPKGHQNFWCSVAGGTSGSSSSPRTELREVTAEGKGLNWLAKDRGHVMLGELRLELIPSSLKVIVGQIHAHGAKNPFLMVSWWKGEARIDFRPKVDGPTQTLARIPCKVGQSFKYLLSVNEGRLSVNLNGIIGTADISEEWEQFPFYFKAGAYVIDHEGPVTEGGWVVYEKLDVLHDE